VLLSLLVFVCVLRWSEAFWGLGLSRDTLDTRLDIRVLLKR